MTSECGLGRENPDEGNPFAQEGRSRRRPRDRLPLLAVDEFEPVSDIPPIVEHTRHHVITYKGHFAGELFICKDLRVDQDAPDPERAIDEKVPVRPGHKVDEEIAALIEATCRDVVMKAIAQSSSEIEVKDDSEGDLR